MDCFYSLLFSCVFVTVWSLPSPPAPPKLTYAGYVYNKNTDAFYKLHTTPAHFSRAKKACEAEGAELMIVSSAEDRFQATALMKEHDIKDMVWVGGIKRKDLQVPWSINEPDDASGIEYYGSVYVKTGLYNDITCESPIGFVCEKEVTVEQIGCNLPK